MITSCKEYDLDDVMAITAIPITSMAADSQFLPYIRTQVAPGTQGFTINYSQATCIGLKPSSDIPRNVPIVRSSGKAKDDEEDDTAGRSHTVSVSCQADDRINPIAPLEFSVYQYLFDLERTPCHLLLTFRGGQRGFVAATNDNYKCTVERDGAKTTVSFRIHNLMGIQFIVA